MVRPSLGAEHWSALIAEQVASGGGVARFAASRGIRASSLSYWKYKQPRRAGRDKPRLAAVHLVDEPPRAGALEIVIDGRRTIRVHPGFDAPTLERLLGVLVLAC